MASSRHKLVRCRSGAGASLACICCLLFPALGLAEAAGLERAEPTRDGVLVRVERLGANGESGFVVTFDRPMQVVSRPSREPAARFQLQLRPAGSVTAPLSRNAVTWTPDPELPLKFLELDVTPLQDVVLTLSFTSVVSMKTEADDGLESLRILVNPVTGRSQASLSSTEAPGGETARQAFDKAVEQNNRKRVTEAYHAIAVGEYDKALELLKVLRESGTPDQVRFAMEFTGVALERSGRADLAATEYRKFLNVYPRAPERARVEQRLSALQGIKNLSMTAGLARQTERKRRDDNGWSSFGSINNSYRFSRNVEDSGRAYEAISMYGLDGDLSARHRSAGMEWQFRLSGGHYEDMRSGGEGSTDRIRYLSVRAETRDRDNGILLGRQRSYGGGVLTRFDGMLMYARMSEHTRLNLVAGYPVNTTEQSFMDDSRSLYGINVDIEDILDALDVNAYFVRQDSDGLLDREAVGGEVSYAGPGSSMYALVDYDVHFGELNAATVSGNHQLRTGSRISWALNARKSPYLSTTNALYGQGVFTLDELKQMLTEDEIEDLANDRTRDSKSATLTLSQPLGERFDLSTSATWLDLSETPASGGVPAYEGSGGQYYLDLRLSGQRLFGRRDLSFVGIRYNSLQTTEIWSFYFNSRLYWGERLSLNPRVRVDHRDNTNGSTQWNVSPGLRLQYQTRRQLFYTEGGMIYYRTEYPELDSMEFKTYFAFVGYQISY